MTDSTEQRESPEEPSGPGIDFEPNPELGHISAAVVALSADQLNAEVTRLALARDAAGLNQMFGGGEPLYVACFKDYDRCIGHSTGILDNLDCGVGLAGCVRKAIFSVLPQKPTAQ